VQYHQQTRTLRENKPKNKEGTRGRYTEREEKRNIEEERRDKALGQVGQKRGIRGGRGGFAVEREGQ